MYADTEEYFSKDGPQHQTHGKIIIDEVDAVFVDKPFHLRKVPGEQDVYKFVYRAMMLADHNGIIATTGSCGPEV